MEIGRKVIYTDFEKVDNSNILKVLSDAIPKHEENVRMIKKLLEYDAGIQQISRVKTYRPDIDCECIDNVANEITEFWLGYSWGFPITLVQRGVKDSGKVDESKAIALLNEQYSAAGFEAKTQELGRFVEITGIGYTFVDINTEYDEEDNTSLFNLEVLSPECTFVVRSRAYTDKRIVLAVTYSENDNMERHYTCFTKDRRFELLGTNVDASKRLPRNNELNPLGRIPIVEWIRSFDRMGVFERQLSEMDNLNLLISDFSNDVDQNTQAIWHANDIDFTEDEEGNLIVPKSNEWVLTETTPDGKQPFITPLAVAYDYAGMLNNINERRAMILQKCNVPMRNSTSGGSTGIAMDSATGWASAETSAAKQQLITESCKMQEVKLALAAIKRSIYAGADNEMLKLRAIDIKPNIKRQKSYEMTVKMNFFATGISHGLNGRHLIAAMNAFDDANQVWEDSKETIEAFQRNLTKDESRLSADNSDEVNNTPLLKG